MRGSRAFVASTSRCAARPIFAGNRVFGSGALVPAERAAAWAPASAGLSALVATPAARRCAASSSSSSSSSGASPTTGGGARLWQRRASIIAMAAAGASSSDLLIVGPGVLGGYAGKLWRDAFPSATVVAQTNSTASHERLKKLGLTPRTRDQADGKKFANVLFAAPPSGSDDYPAEVAAATKLWDGTGSFVFTSSMSVCAAEDGSTVSEDRCPLVPEGKSPSTDRLLGAEKATLDAGGNVLRLVGLYHAQRGPHTFFIRQGEVARYAGYTVNMLHYEDAAGLAVAILRSDGASDGAWRGRIFVGTDGKPLTFQEMVDACFVSGVFSGTVNFTAPAPAGGVGLGKRVTNDVTRAALGGWKPKYPSFEEFFQTTKGSDFYTSSGLF